MTDGSQKYTSDAHVTLGDVARAVGLHVSTVSRALHNDPTIPVATRTRIQNAAQTLGYRIDPLVAALMRSRRLGRPIAFKANLGLLVAEAKSEAWRPTAWMFDICAGARRRALARGYSLEVFWLSDLHENAGSFARMLRARNIHGIILPPEHEATLPFALPWPELSVVSLHYGASRTTPRFHQVVSNHFHSVLEVCRECSRRGYRRPGLILRDRPDIHYEYGRLVHGAFLAATNSGASPPAAPALLVRDLEVGRIAAWIKEHRPDVVITAGGGFSAQYDMPQFTAALAREGHFLGRDFGFVLMCHRPTPEIAVVDERVEVIGEVAMDLLITQLQRNDRGIPAEPLICQVDGVFHPGLTLPTRG